ncbi:hypothetical protein F7725_016931 [Dissostichus mawsoni]|uniref:Uncharacterized protein n=1 Tax=Dissostichus mawsoni TaxID=36200 RepID=A0A7J5Z787_DISMA|nr:hypothetical protein F7725_016931 [Dissostichus mawsoni]
MNMVLLKLLIFTLTFYEHIFYLDAKSCPKGEKVVRAPARVEYCESCPDETIRMKIIIPKTANLVYSVIKRREVLLKRSAQKRQTLNVSAVGDLFTMMIPVANNVQNVKRDFSAQVSTHSVKNGKSICKSGVQLAGNKNSDVRCNVDTTPTTSNETVSLLTRLTSHHSHWGDKTQNPATNIKTTTSSISTTSTTAAPGHRTDKGPPFYPSDLGTYTGAGMVLIIIGMIGLLVLTAVTCKLRFNPKPAVTKSESLCRSPVEESGDDSQSSLKLNPEEP